MLAFRYPLGRELRHCRRPDHVLHTVKWWRDYRSWRGRRPLVKEPHAVFSVDWFARRLQSDVVVTVRHPAAVVASWKRLGWSFDFGNVLEQPALMRETLAPFEQEMRDALDPSFDAVDRISLLWRIVYVIVDEMRERHPGVHLVRQEDLSQSPAAGFRELYRKVGLCFGDAAEAAVSSSSRAGNPEETSVERPHATTLDSAANLRNWRRRLTEEEIARIRAVTRDAAARYYTADDW